MLILDNREVKIIELIKSSAVSSIQYKTENLSVGDIIIQHLATDNKTYEIIIERKCVCDMVASIKDGRYKEQKLRLLSQQKQNVKIAYLIEGIPTDLRLPQDKVMLAGSIISSIFRDTIPIIRTYSLQETIDIISRLHDRLNKDYKEFFPQVNTLQTTHEIEPSRELILDTTPETIPETIPKTIQETINTNVSTNVSTDVISNIYLASIKKNKKENMTPQLWNINCLCGIPGVSNAIAVKIAEHYPTIRKLLDAYNILETLDEKESLLSQITLCETDKQKRRIGNVISKRIYDYFYC